MKINAIDNFKQGVYTVPMQPKKMYSREDFVKWGACGGAISGRSRSPARLASLKKNAAKARKAYVLSRRHAAAQRRQS